MSSMAVDADEDERTHLLHNNSSPPVPYRASDIESVEIVPSPSSNEPDEPTPKSVDQNQRLASLDVFRGLTVALMILVDDAGGAFPSINHSPWFGVTLADFVMPFFLFGVGVSTGLVFKRISIGYLFASFMDIWLVNNIVVDSALAFVKRYYIQWMVAFLLGSLYMCLLYGLYVPNWKYEVPSTNSSSSTSRYGFDSQVVHCGMRGSLQPPCNAVGLVDRFFLGVQHLYQHPVYRRTKECSVNSPDYGPLPLNSPEWCLAPFDPEGILSSLMAAITCVVGLHYGHIIVHFKGHRQRVFWWSISSFPLLISGYVLKVLGIPFSKPLYTLSYMCITAGASGFLLTIIFYIVDVNQVKKPTMVL
ncbi:heparan-alpha-glucosaminide N-acetyltransferase-like isoform X2 [Camellia sinensis]|uniref:heparan-alpha-glucosaminide N-acetyltransferase-like isoform X2 n=1 Tax=Camellia sinensis TaxID=4442 RepID=UPI001036B99A|nr:heparan-alpha-glucosaminide N-acetyltransferase-like isoform X2 [Camellia sinensis]